MAIGDPASVKAVSRAAARQSRLRGGDPLYIQDLVDEPKQSENPAFRSSSPITAHVLDTTADLLPLGNKYHSAIRRHARRRQINRFRRLHPKILKALPLGMISLSLYALLFANEHQVMAMSLDYWWSFLVPASIALVFSLAHGSFTGAFWDAIGLQPNTIRK